MSDADKKASFPIRHASDLTELWQNDAQEALLNLYAVTVGVGKPLFSDYDRFCALCHLMPLMHGHAEAARCHAILRETFGIDERICPQSCDKIWRLTSEALLMQPRSLADVYAADKNDSATERRVLYTTDLPTPDVRLLIDAWRDLQSWEGEINLWLDKAGQNGACVTLETDFSYVKPDPYHVRLALQSTERSKTEQALLTAQLLRILCIDLRACGGCLQLDVKKCGNDAVALLSYLENSVGLPEIMWSTDDARERELLLAFSLQRHDRAVLPVLRPKREWTTQHLNAEITNYATRFPVGLLKIIETEEYHHD